MQALCKLIDQLPAAFPAPILAVLHTFSGGPRLLAKLLGECTAMPVSYGADGERVEQGHVYLAPPDRHLVSAAPGVLELDRGPKVRHSRPSADRLFQSAAHVYGPRVIGVLLTGGDEDGTDGLRSINAAGGIGVVQEPQEARDPSMPLDVLPAGFPDYRLPLDEIAEMLRKLIDGEK